jgi:predicted Zn-dependent protease
LNKKPERIRLKTLNSAITLEQALKNYGVPAARVKEIAILNGMELTQKLPKGTIIKILGT